jgi:hypothetical protein
MRIQINKCLALALVCFSFAVTGNAHTFDDKKLQKEADPQACVINKYDHRGYLDGGYYEGFNPNRNVTSSPTLAPFWAQENTGLDFVYEELKNAPREILIGVIDTGINFTKLPEKSFADHGYIQSSDSSHGTAVANLILGKFPMGASPVARLEYFTRYTQADWMAKQIKEKKIRVVNLSLGGVDKEIIRVAQETILVTSSGNDYFKPVGPKKDVGAIIVGSSSFYGVLSDFSQQDPSVDVLAPSDNYIQSISDKQTYSSFGGTSGAAPLVTGAIANVISVLPQLDTTMAKQLLKKTSLPLAITPPAPGQLNALKLYESAKRISLACPNNVECIRAILNPKTEKEIASSKEILNFEKEAALLAEQAQKLIGSNACDEKRDGVKLLRKSFLLNPTELVRSQLEKLHRDVLLQATANYYASFKKGAVDSIKDGTFKMGQEYINTYGSIAHARRAKYRNQILLTGEKPEAFIEKLLNSKMPDDRIAAAQLAAHSNSMKLVSKILEDTDEDVRLEGVAAAWKAHPFALMHAGQKDTSPMVRALAVDFFYLSDQPFQHLMDKSVSDSSAVVRQRAVQVMQRLLDNNYLNEKIKIMQHLEMLSKDPDAKVRALASDVLTKNNKKLQTTDYSKYLIDKE